MKYFSPVTIFLFLIFSITACNPKNDLESIGKLEQSLREANYNQATDTVVSPKVKQQAEKLILAYQSYAKENTVSEISADFLCKAAGLAELYSDSLSESMKIYKQIVEEYPATQAEMQALHRLGYLYKYRLHQPDEALKYYEIFVQKYPFTTQSMEIKQIIDSLKNGAMPLSHRSVFSYNSLFYA